MAAQSRPPILITRPEPQASRFARTLRAQDWTGRVFVAALMKPVFLTPDLPAFRAQAVILTSETAALAARHLSGLPQQAWCVGDRTAQVARAQGFVARSAKGDAAALVAAILAAAQPGPLLYLHGRETRGDVAAGLNSAGIETHPLLVYAQEPCPLTASARRQILQTGPVILPVLSPRSAELLVAAWRAAEARAEAHIVAFSPAVAEAVQAISPASVTITGHPDGGSLLAALKAVATADRWA
jgi:uroporphyrinogen-III synthase